MMVNLESYLKSSATIILMLSAQLFQINTIAVSSEVIYAVLFVEIRREEKKWVNLGFTLGFSFNLNVSITEMPWWDCLI